MPAVGAGDKILIEGLEVFARHGVDPAERKLGQRFVIDVEVTVDLEAAGRTDDLGASVDYAAVADTAVEAATVPPARRLIEAVAEAVAARVLDRFAPVAAVRVRVRKPAAPIRHRFASVGVEVVRERRRPRAPGRRRSP